MASKKTAQWIPCLDDDEPYYEDEKFDNVLPWEEPKGDTPTARLSALYGQKWYSHSKKVFQKIPFSKCNNCKEFLLTDYQFTYHLKENYWDHCHQTDRILKRAGEVLISYCQKCKFTKVKSRKELD